MVQLPVTLFNTICAPDDDKAKEQQITYTRANLSKPVIKGIEVTIVGRNCETGKFGCVRNDSGPLMW